MKHRLNVKKTGRNLLIYLYVLLLLLTLLVAASYTWFGLSRTPTVSDLEMYVNAAPGLELSQDYLSDLWSQQLDFPTLVNASSAPLKPATWSEEQQCFLAASYGLDGRLTGWRKLSDEENANRDDDDGYYVRCVFYARTGQGVTVSLTPAVPMEDGTAGSGTFLIGSPKWNSEKIYHENGGLGAELAMRFGFRMTKMDENGNILEPRSELYIYEPNCNNHLYADNVYSPTESIDGTQTLVPANRLILQTTTAWTESNPVQREQLQYFMGEFQTETKLFELQPDEIMKIELYIWLEGQDADCIGQVDQAEILASIQFKVDPNNQSGLLPIS